MRSSLLALVVICTLGALACQGDPNDPNTWAKQLTNLRTQKEALDHLANMDVEKARPAVPALMDLYKDTRRPEHLEALARYKDERTKALFIEALDYSDDDFDRATIAAGVLGEMKAPEAVEPLIHAAEKQLPIKSRANNAKLAALRALVKVGDKRAVPTLMKILGTSADEQDFTLNQKAALGLAEFRDPQAIPALIKGLFMTGRGANIFQECRLGLVRIGAPAIPPLVELLKEKNAEIQAMAKQLKFDSVTPGVVPFKAAVLLGDLRARQSVPELIARLREKAHGGEHTAIVIALGQIAEPAGVDALIGILKDAKQEATLRVSSADGLYLSGDRRAVPTLMEIAKSGYVVVQGQKASDLRATAAIDLSRIAGKESFEAFKALAEKESAAQGVFGMALDRMMVANECDKDLACYGKKLNDPSWTRAEKAAFAIGFSGDAAKGLPLLLAAMKPVASMSQERFPVHQAILYSLARLGTKSCKECTEKLDKQIERDEKAIRIPGARDLLGETRVTQAIILNKDTNDAPPVVVAAAASEPAAKGKGKGKAKAAGKKGRKK
ncbi:MAG TPA: HEAT repeat domain-containing protein [Polyangia bacterium]|jgi:HEAT repeat protein|nr:HEAT repeat domain-containing protein [Polyangia bacterium]